MLKPKLIEPFSKIKKIWRAVSALVSSVKINTAEESLEIKYLAAHKRTIQKLIENNMRNKILTTAEQAAELKKYRKYLSQNKEYLLD